jgi:hypothetical protein
VKDPTFAPAYVVFYPMLAEVAREHGYALAVHGSIVSDFDLVAIPWTDDAASVSELIAGISSYASRVFTDMFPNATTIHGPEKKPHGRIAFLIALGNGASIDLSIIQKQKT